MKLLTVKMVRFAIVVEKCGQPQAYTLWQKPAADRRFQSLVRNNRLMTVQRAETGTDFGTVGYCERKGARFLEFTKSLKRFEEKRVVGIDWALVKP